MIQFKLALQYFTARSHCCIRVKCCTMTGTRYPSSTCQPRPLDSDALSLGVYVAFMHIMAKSRLVGCMLAAAQPPLCLKQALVLTQHSRSSYMSDSHNIVSDCHKCGIT